MVGEQIDNVGSSLKDTSLSDVLMGSTLYTVLLFAGLAVLPLAFTTTYVYLVTEMMIFALFALAFGFLYGFSGVVSFGHAAFFGLGAYALALANVHLGTANFWVLAATAILVASVYALVIGYISIRASGVYFAILTLAWAQITFIFVQNYTDITGGTNGMLFEPPNVVVIPGMFEFSVLDVLPFYYLTFALLLASFLFLRQLTISSLGAVMKGIRENRERTQYLGYKERWYRIIVFTISGAVSGLAGALSASMTSFVSPSVMEFILSGEVIVWTIIGGRGSLIGPIIGAGLIHYLEDLLSTQVTWWFIPIGLVFIVLVIFMPDGIVGGLKRLRSYIKSR
jgi:branched-chain amino acid transport system permease protein